VSVLTWVIDERTEFLTRLPVVTYTLTITVTAGGTTSPAPGTYEHPETTVVSVTAIPDAGYVFVRHEVDGVEHPENPVEVIMDADHVVHTVFEPTVGQATITGTVLDEETGMPVEGARVVADGYETETGSEGVFSLTVPLGSYVLTITKAGYVGYETTVDALAEQVYDLGTIYLAPVPIVVPWVFVFVFGPLAVGSISTAVG